MSCIKTIAESTAGGRKLFKIKTITKVNEKRLKVKEIVPLIKTQNCSVRIEVHKVRFWMPFIMVGPF